MANREQLRLLKAGVEGWNIWRQENPEIAINLQGANFKEQSLQGANLGRADIRGANFKKADLTGASFVQARAGLRKNQAAFVLLCTWLQSGILGILGAAPGIFVKSIFTASSPEEKIAGCASLIALIVGCAVLLFGKFNVLRFAAITAGSIAFLFSVVGAFTFNLGGVSSLAATLGGVISVAMAFVFVFAEALASTVAGTIRTAGLQIGVAVGVISGVTQGWLIALSDSPVAGIISGIISVFLVLISNYISWRAIKKDEKYSSIFSTAVKISAIGGTYFRNAILTDADFSQACLQNADFRDATILRTNWHLCQQLNQSRCDRTTLDTASVRDLAVTHDGRGKSYINHDLKGINLRGADLSDADLTEADLSEATLENAVLERANLSRVRALRTQLCQTNLTAACIEAWNIDNTTELDGIVCDHVYLLNNQKECRPSSGSFAPGEFTKLFEEVLNTIDLIFRDGVDWKAFVSTFRDIQVQNEDTDLTIQSIENKGDGFVVVKVQASEGADKAKIHAEFSELYQVKLQALEAQYRAQLEAKDSEIASYRRENANMLEITKLLASKPINVKEYNQTNYGGVNYQNDISDGQVNQGETINITPNPPEETSEP